MRFTQQKSQRNLKLVKYISTALNINFNFIIIIIVIEKDRQCKAGRERFTHYQSNQSKEKPEEEKKRASSLDKWNSIGPALETRQSQTIEYMVSMI